MGQDLVSPLLRFALERCDFFGLNKGVIASRAFSQEHVKSLEDEAYKKGADQPREKALLYLTAARLLQEIGSEDVSRLRGHLRQYCASFGDWVAVCQGNLDVIRNYYTEAFSVDSKWGAQLDIKARQYIISYVWDAQDLISEEKIPKSIKAAVAEVFRPGRIPVGFWDGMLDLLIVSRTSAREILPIVHSHVLARISALDFLRLMHEAPASDCNQQAFIDAWEKARRQRKEQQDRIAEKLETHRRMIADAMTPECVVRLSECLIDCADEDWLCDLDKEPHQNLSQRRLLDRPVLPIGLRRQVELLFRDHKGMR